jgi:hypothetical protein
MAEWIGMGLENGIISTDGGNCRLGSYGDREVSDKWVSVEQSNGGPECNWNSLVRAACFVRLWEPCCQYGLTVRHNDGPIDLAVSREDDVLWCIEVGEKIASLKQSVDYLVERAGDLGTPPRLPIDSTEEKVNYILKREPQFLSCVAIDGQEDFWVKREMTCFSLVESDPPLYMPHHPVAVEKRVAEEVAA